MIADRPAAASVVAAVAARVRGLGRGDLAVIAFCALGAGNVWARRGTGNVDEPPSAPEFVLGFALILLAGGLCYLAVRRPSTLPTPGVCAAAIGLQTCLEPTYMFPIPELFVVGLMFAAVPLIGSRRLAWGVLAGAILVSAVAVGNIWKWGWASIDVFAEVQGGAAALLHGQNPYAATYGVFLSWNHAHPLFGVGSLCYGPMVVLLSVPSRLLGDVRLTVLALNIAILAAVLVWARRGLGNHRMATTLTALWAASPFVPFMVLTEWTDTFSVAAVAWWLVLRDRHRAWATLVLTIGIAAKPSALLVIVPMLVWTAEARRELVWAAVGTLVIVAPFALWTGVPQFVYDTVGVFGDLPVRTDGVTVDGLASALGRGLVPGAVLVAGIAAAVATFASRRPRDYGAMLAAGAGMVVFVCIFGKQAFLNYYFIAAMALLLLIGAGRMHPRDPICSPAEHVSADLRRLRGRRTQPARA